MLALNLLMYLRSQNLIKDYKLVGHSLLVSTLLDYDCLPYRTGLSSIKHAPYIFTQVITVYIITVCVA